MATSDMYKSNGKENLLVLNKANSAAQYPGATVYADGAVYTSDSDKWNADTVKPYTTDTLPDPATLAPGVPVLVDGVVSDIATGRLIPTGLMQQCLQVSSGLRIISSTSSQTAVIAITKKGTFDQQIPANGPFKGVRLIYGNFDTAASYDIAASKVAAAPKHLASMGSEMTWNNVTFDAALTGTVPKAVQGSAQVAPGLLISDLIPLPSVARADSGTRPLIRVRTLIDATSAAKTLTLLGTGGLSTLNSASFINGYQVGSYNSLANDLVTTTSDANSVLENGGPIAVIGAIFITDSQIDTAAVFGDSLFQGVSTVRDLCGWPVRATIQDKGLSCVNMASAGQKTIDSYLTMKKYLQSNKPTFVVFKSWSPNDGATAENFGAAWALTMGMIDLCRENNVTPIVLTSGPVNGYSASQNSLRLTQNAKTLELSKLGVVVVDASDVITTPGADNAINPLYNGGDGLHYNDACHLAIANQVLTSLAYT